MSISTYLPHGSNNLVPLNRGFFGVLQPAGRKITAGFTYLQRISKTASFDVWFPEALKRELKKRVQQNQNVGFQQFPAQWAAVREFELLQEAGNHKIYDLDPSNLMRATQDLSKGMRAGGYRVTVATLGTYEGSASGDELEILDIRLQERISQMIHMLYLDSESDKANSLIDAKLKSGRWDYLTQLSHVGCALGAADVFSPAHKPLPSHKQARQFFDVLSQLPQNHIIHDTAIGLQLPELNGNHQWNYIADPQETLAAFNGVLANLFDNHVFHLRGYGDRLTPSSEAFYRSAALALN